MSTDLEDEKESHSKSSLKRKKSAKYSHGELDDSDVDEYSSEEDLCDEDTDDDPEEAEDTPKVLLSVCSYFFLHFTLLL